MTTANSRIARLNQLPGWSTLSDEDQKALQKFVIRADADAIDGMTPSEMERWLHESSVELPRAARRILIRGLTHASGIFPALKLPARASSGIEPSSEVADTTLTAAFDGSRSIKMWVDTMEFARDIKAKYGKALPIAYFINTAYFDPNVKGSWIGKAKSAEEAQLRWALVQTAVNDGHEIGNHTVRHHNGEKWTDDQWQKELTEFHQLVEKNLFQPIYDDQGKPVFPRWEKVDVPPGGGVPENAVQRSDGWYKPTYPIEYKGEVLFDDEGRPNLDHPDLVPYRTVGFRAPELGYNSALYRVLERMGYVYDTSKIHIIGRKGKSHYARVTQAGSTHDLWLFPLVRYRPEMSTVPMDYNYLANKIGGDVMEADYRRAILRAAANGEPWNIGHHFSLWKGGAYWKAMKKALEFAAEGCPDETGKARCNVEFRTFGQVAEELGDPRVLGDEPNS